MFVSVLDAIIEPSIKPHKKWNERVKSMLISISQSTCYQNTKCVRFSFCVCVCVSISNGIYQLLLLEYCWLVLYHSEQSHQTYWAHRFENIHLNLVHSFLINKTLDLCICAFFSLPLRFVLISNSFFGSNTR